MAMTSMNISLPEELKEYVEEQTEGGYSTPSEYVRELIRADQKHRAKGRLDAILLEGLSSGVPIPVTPKFLADLKQEALAKLGTQKKPKRWRSGRRPKGVCPD